MSVSKEGFLYLSLLALQFGLQPVLSTLFIPKACPRAIVVISAEVFKVGIAAFSISWMASAEVEKVFHGWTIRNSVRVAAVPAILYAIQNLLVQTGYHYVDSTTFNLLNQTKTLSAALWLWILLGKKQSVTQIFALFLLLAAAVVLNFPSSMSDSRDVDWISKRLGLICIFSASLLSGLSTALTQHALQGKNRNSMLFSAELAIYGVLFLLIKMAVSGEFQALTADSFRGWSTFTFIPILSQSFGGLVVGLVTKHAGGVLKGFALIAGLMMTAVFQTFVSAAPITTAHLIAFVCVALAIFLHTRFPYISKDKETAVPATNGKEQRIPALKKSANGHNTVNVESNPVVDFMSYLLPSPAPPSNRKHKKID